MRGRRGGRESNTGRVNLDVGVDRFTREMYDVRSHCCNMENTAYLLT